MKKFLIKIFFGVTFVFAFLGVISLVLLLCGFIPMQENSNSFDWNAISAISAFVSAISTALYLIATVMILKENQKTNELSQLQYKRLISPNIVADFCLDQGYYIRLVVRNEGGSSATSVKIHINCLDDWIKVYESEKKHKIIAMSCSELKNNTFTLVPKKEKYFTIGIIDIPEVLREDVEVRIEYNYLDEPQEPISFTHNLQLYAFINGDNADSVNKLSKSISDLTYILQSSNQKIT